MHFRMLVVFSVTSLICWPDVSFWQLLMHFSNLKWCHLLLELICYFMLIFLFRKLNHLYYVLIFILTIINHLSCVSNWRTTVAYFIRGQWIADTKCIWFCLRWVRCRLLFCGYMRCCFGVLAASGPLMLLLRSSPS